MRTVLLSILFGVVGWGVILAAALFIGTWEFTMVHMVFEGAPLTPSPVADPGPMGVLPFQYASPTPMPNPRLLSTSYITNKEGERYIFKSPRGGVLYTVEVREVESEEGMPELVARPPRQVAPTRIPNKESK